MIFLAGVAAALALGVGLVVQQRVASRADLAQPLSWDLVRRVVHSRLWWSGTGLLVAGQALGGWALQLGPVSLVEALLSTSLLFAFVAAAVVARHRPGVREVIGAVLLSAALGTFIAVARPRSARDGLPGWPLTVVAAAAVAGVALVLVLVARRRGLTGEAILLATAVGVLYGLQDAGSRALFVAVERRGLLVTLLASPWPYLVVGCAAAGLLLAQSAFRAGRLDHALPPTAAAEPLVGVALGVSLLGDRLAVSDGALAVESLCVLAMLAGVVLIGRSRALGRLRVRSPATS